MQWQHREKKRLKYNRDIKKEKGQHNNLLNLISEENKECGSE